MPINGDRARIITDSLDIHGVRYSLAQSDISDSSITRPPCDDGYVPVHCPQVDCLVSYCSRSIHTENLSMLRARLSVLRVAWVTELDVLSAFEPFEAPR